MNAENRELLEEVIKKNLEETINAEPGSDEEKRSLTLAMEAIDRDTAINKNDDSYQEHIDDLNFKKEESKKEIEFKTKESKNNWIRWGIELGAVYLLAPMIDKKIKEGFAKLVMTWEETNTFTTTPGRRIGDFFKFKR